MPRFFITAAQIGTTDDGKKTVMILGDDASHITRSLRMKEGDPLVVCDMAGVEYSCSVTSVGDTVTADVLSEKKSDTEPPYRATLYQALIKGDKFDTVVQKAVECGVSKIVPVLTERCVVRLSEKDCAKKAVRWQRIADEAAKQCGRGSLVEICPLMSFKEAVRSASEADVPLFCYEAEDGTTLKSALKEYPGTPGTVSFIIGSEGGFSTSEAEYAAANGMKSVGLGKRILRTETAPSFVLSCLVYEYEL